MPADKGDIVTGWEAIHSPDVTLPLTQVKEGRLTFCTSQQISEITQERTAELLGGKYRGETFVTEGPGEFSVQKHNLHKEEKATRSH